MLTFSAGTFKQPLFAADGMTCNGVETIDGTKYYADKVVLAAGAWSPVLIDLEDQCVSKVSTRSWVENNLPAKIISHNTRPGSLLISNSHHKKWQSTRTSR